MVSASLARVRSEIASACARSKRDPESIAVVGVTKGKSVERVQEGIEAGLKILGENRVQEAIPKIERIGLAGVEWHLIGHLQRNKVRFVPDRFSMVQSVDSLELVHALDRRLDARLDILIEVNVAEEPQKTGALGDTVIQIATAAIASTQLRLVGLMAIAPQSPDPERARPYFKKLASLQRELAARLAIPLPVLSMGMTDDFAVAVEEGSTMLRLGRALFGSR